MMKKITPLLLLLLPALALAAEEAQHAGEAEGIPHNMIYQVINFLIYVGVLFYFLHHPVKTYFREREEKFRSALFKAERAKQEAETSKREVMSRLATLEGSAAQSIEQAKAETEALKAKIIAEAVEMSQKLRDDARRTTTIEIERAKNELREELLSQAMIAAKKVLSDKIAENDQHRLQNEFVDKIQVVR